jgi:hypothetical protein
MHSSERSQTTPKKAKKPFFSRLFGINSKKKGSAAVSQLTLSPEPSDADPAARVNEKVQKPFQNRIAKWVAIKKSISVDSTEIFITPPTNAHLLDADQDLLQETQPLYASSVDDLNDDLDLHVEEEHDETASSIDSLAHNQRRAGVYIPSLIVEKPLPWETTHDCMISHLVSKNSD